MKKILLIALLFVLNCTISNAATYDCNTEYWEKELGLRMAHSSVLYYYNGYLNGSGEGNINDKISNSSLSSYEKFKDFINLVCFVYPNFSLMELSLFGSKIDFKTDINLVVNYKKIPFSIEDWFMKSFAEGKKIPVNKQENANKLFKCLEDKVGISADIKESYSFMEQLRINRNNAFYESKYFNIFFVDEKLPKWLKFTKDFEICQ